MDIQKEQLGKKLSNDFMNQLSNIIDGNNVTLNEIKMINYEIDNFEVLLNIVWKFMLEYNDTKSAGGSYIGTRCNTINDLEYITNELEYKVKTDKNLRTGFITNFTELGREGILNATKKNLIKKFGKFSVKDTCHNCNGKCKVKCNSCGGHGTHRCSNCHGSGRVTKFRYDNYNKRQESYSAYCDNCNGRGNKNCSSCSGTREVSCLTCNGYGYFMIIRELNAITKPNYFVYSNSKLMNEELEKYLNKRKIEFLNETIYFEFYKHKSDYEDDEQFIYLGKSTILKQYFSVKIEEYTCYTFSNPPHAFIKPPIFDDLFVNEVELIKKEKKKAISKKKALELFNSYSKFPVLDKAIKDISINRKKDNENTSEYVIKSCQGYITQNCALVFSNYINKFMDKVSPSYSPFIWFFGLFFLSIIGVVYFEYLFEEQGTKVILESIITFIGVSFILMLIFYPLDLLLTWLKRRKIPSEYRQKLRYKEPLKLFSQGSFIILSVVLAYGILSNKNYLPKTNGMPQYILLKNLNDGCENFENNGLDICQKIGLNKVIIHFPLLNKIPIKYDELKYINKLRNTNIRDSFYLYNRNYK
jgi:hypothetical protein